jgi:hypothetical protein
MDEVSVASTRATAIERRRSWQRALFMTYSFSVSLVRGQHECAADHTPSIVTKASPAKGTSAAIPGQVSDS